MITCISSLTLPDRSIRAVRRAAEAGFMLAALAGCGNAPAAGSESEAAAAAASPVQEALEPGRTGAPAQPLADAGDVAATSRVISKEELAQKFPGNGAKAGCFITFAYAGELPETLIWDDEPCTALTTLFMTPADLKRSNDWDRLDSTDQQKVMALPDQRVLYVGGEFTASIYPLDTNNLTYEIVVSD
jgi:hypothetical protein